MKISQLACHLLGIVCQFGALTPAAAGQPAHNEAEKFVAQGDAFRSNGKTTEALWAYRQAATAGNVNGAFAAGDMLVLQAQTAEGRERVLKLSEGLGFLFAAATNRHPQACAELSNALQNGIGVRTNLAGAYAWLEVAAQTAPAFRADLDRLVVRLEPGDVLEAQKMAREYISGHWPDRFVRPVEEGDPRLQIQGVSGSGNETLIVLNGDTVTVGESINVFPVNGLKSKSGPKLAVSCREIGPDYALLAVAGERDLKMLPLDPR